MKTMFSVKVIPMLAAAALAQLASLAHTSSEQKTLTGVVSDAMCGSAHTMKDKPAAECLHYAAQKVSVKGTLKGEILTVESVSLAK
jgi:hypothetical protein